MRSAEVAIRSAGRALSLSANFNAIWSFLQRAVVQRELLAVVTKREMTSAHANHGLGGLWVFVHPLIIVTTYLLIFGFVLGSRLDLGSGLPGDYPSYILVGLVPWLITQAAMVRSASALVSNANLVKQVVFPIEILPIGYVAAAIIPYAPSLLMVLAYKILFAGGLPWTVVFLPAIFVMHAAIVIGLGFLLAGLTAFIRDLRELVTVFCVIAMYFTPAVYLPEWVPTAIRPLLYLNPFSYLTWVYQDALFFGGIQHPYSWFVTALMAIMLLGGGYRTFEKLKPYYGNVL